MHLTGGARMLQIGGSAPSRYETCPVELAILARRADPPVYAGRTAIARPCRASKRITTFSYPKFAGSC